MHLRLAKIFALLMLFLAAHAVATINVYPFDDPALEKRFNVLVNELRCPKCQNNNLVDSNAGIAKDLKDLVYEKVLAGESDKQIVDYLVLRYGDFVSYDPPMDSRTWVIWFGPFVVLLGGLFGVIVYTRKRATNSKRSNKASISDENKKVLSKWADENPASDRGSSE